MTSWTPDLRLSTYCSLWASEALPLVPSYSPTATEEHVCEWLAPGSYTRQCSGWDSNPWPLDHSPDAVPLVYPVTQNFQDALPWKQAGDPTEVFEIFKFWKVCHYW